MGQLSGASVRCAELVPVPAVPLRLPPPSCHVVRCPSRHSALHGARGCGVGGSVGPTQLGSVASLPCCDCDSARRLVDRFCRESDRQLGRVGRIGQREGRRAAESCVPYLNRSALRRRRCGVCGDLDDFAEVSQGAVDLRGDP
eukprot:Amastigsp_a849737_21.p2 type:complete len:143 gc:universal Amastigsp_a849737_21:338-766(+)